MQTTGKEIPVLNGTEEIHVTADVAYAVWQYWQATADREFLRHSGVEILAETARFWASRCTRNLGSYHIHGVIGPDEYHSDGPPSVSEHPGAYGAARYRDR